VLSSTGGIIVEATLLSAAHPTVADQTTEQPETTADVSREQAQSTAELRRLMDLADRYARQLVAAAKLPPGVLLLVHQGDLDVVTLDGADPDVRALPRLLARRRPSSAAVVVAAEGTLGEAVGDVVLVVGETGDGLRDERRYRVRACGGTRRLTRLADHDASETPRATPRLFPPRAVPTA
jgi:hypothetical protein